jgi:hypothetical protein
LSKPRDSLKNRVRIAILDTGIDRNDEVLLAFKERIKLGRSWVDNIQEGDGNDIDEFGHGTHTAALLCTIAPEADIYIGRVCKGKALEDPVSIAKVIFHAHPSAHLEYLTLFRQSGGPWIARST